MPAVLSPALSLERYLEVSRKRYDACLERIDHTLTITGMPTVLEFHRLQFDGNGRPKFETLAQILARHIVMYCLSAQARGNPQGFYDQAALYDKARDLFRALDATGEAGEILLYFLMEAVHEAPQMVAKMSLKTSPKVEVNGSDGIHMKWCEQDGCLDIYFGEAKLHQSVADALRSAFESIERFHLNRMEEHELEMVTSHFKYADDATREAVLRWVRKDEPGGVCRINHACLIGYDWSIFGTLAGKAGQDLERSFRRAYTEDFARLHKLLQARISACRLQSLRFLVFFLPFADVEEFRQAFRREVG